MTFNIQHIDFNDINSIHAFNWVEDIVRTIHLHKQGKSYKKERKSEQLQDARVLSSANSRAFIAIVPSEYAARLVAFYYPDDPETGFIGWYECTNNPALSNEMISEACDWLKKEGCRKVIGPINGSTWYSYRFNMTSEDPLFPGEPNQPMYFIDQWKNAGFIKSVNYITEKPSKNIIVPSDEEDVRSLLVKSGLKLLRFPSNPDESVRQKLYDFFHLCFENNPLFRPIILEDYTKLISESKLIMDPGLTFLVMDSEENIVGAYLSYMDAYHLDYILQKLQDEIYANNKLIIKTIATHPNRQNQQIGTIIINLIHNLAYKNGYDEVVHALMYSDNISAKKGREKFKTKVIREYCLMEKEL